MIKKAKKNCLVTCMCCCCLGLFTGGWKFTLMGQLEPGQKYVMALGTSYQKVPGPIFTSQPRLTFGYKRDHNGGASIQDVRVWGQDASSISL
jgi:hypothetical protein